MKITIVEADRPADDSIESWRKIVTGYLKDDYRKQKYIDMEFVECDTCAAKPGTPALCAGCLANRETISRLHKK
jgi:hypothetical protein